MKTRLKKKEKQRLYSIERRWEMLFTISANRAQKEASC